MALQKNSSNRALTQIAYLWSWFTDSICVPWTNHKIKVRPQSGVDYDEIRRLSDKDIEDYIKDEWVRAKELDAKLAQLSAALSVALTLCGTAPTFILGQLTPGLAQCVFFVLILVSILLFLYGAFLGFNGLKPKPRFGYGAEYLNEVAAGGSVAREAQVAAAEGFLVWNQIRSNETSAAIDIIRNGMIFFGLALTCGYFSFNYDSTNSYRDQHERDCICESRGVTANPGLNEAQARICAPASPRDSIETLPSGRDLGSEHAVDSGSDCRSGGASRNPLTDGVNGSAELREENLERGADKGTDGVD